MYSSFMIVFTGHYKRGIKLRLVEAISMAEVTAYSVALSVLAFLIILSNSAVCLLVVRYRQLRTHTNGFVVSLAASDVIVGMSLCLYSLVDIDNNVTNVMFATGLLTSMYNICGVTYDRYLAVNKPLVYIQVISKHLPRIVALTWISSFAMAALPLAWQGKNKMSYLMVYQLCLVAVWIVLPSLLIFIWYCRIVIQVRKCVKREKEILHVHSVSVREERKRVSTEAKVASVFAIITVTFICCWFPLIFITTAFAVGKVASIPLILAKLSPFTMALSSLVNPFLYCFMKPDFKLVLKKIFPLRRSRRTIKIRDRDNLQRMSRVSGATLNSRVHDEEFQSSL